VAIEVKIDPLTCALTGYCQRTAPQIFEIRPDQPVVSVKMPGIEDPALIELAREAEASCPTGAIVIEE
jgi:ferredoxin